MTRVEIIYRIGNLDLLSAICNPQNAPESLSQGMPLTKLTLAKYNVFLEN